jgi:hypothetical protein
MAMAKPMDKMEIQAKDLTRITQMGRMTRSAVLFAIRLDSLFALRVYDLLQP